MFLKLLDRLGRKRIIMDLVNNEPYLERYYLFLKERHWFPFNIFLHKFLKGDPDDVHDHPWPYATLILKGGYYEWVPEFSKDGSMCGQRRYWRGLGHCRISSANSYHRVELKDNVTAWTLFIPGPQKRDWGFLVRNKWVQHEEYMQNRRAKT